MANIKPAQKRISIIYKGNIEWIGGVYYIQNLISALNTLDDLDKPIIDVYCGNRKAFEELSAITRYPYLNYNEYKVNKTLDLINKVLLITNLSKRFIFNSFKIHKDSLFVFPLNFGRRDRILAWIPDFQELHLTYLFNKKQQNQRKRNVKKIESRLTPVVFSSYDALNDYKTYYNNTPLKTFVAHFAVTLPDFSILDISDIKKTYNIDGEYFFCANQFWRHKNHLFLFEAFHQYSQTHPEIQLVCTGRLEDKLDPTYIDQIKLYLDENNLCDKIKILGFIQREEMLCLMKNSLAVIQPSLFEGWSTVIEDAKCLSKFVYASNLKVNQEQINKNVCFFNPHDVNDLAMKLTTCEKVKDSVDYSNNVKLYATTFLDIINYFDKMRI